MPEVPTPMNKESLVKEYALYMASEMLKIANEAGSEEDVRLGCSHLISNFLKKADIEVKGQHEYGLAGGRIDSLYGGVIIEYKDPNGAGKISLDSSASGTKAVIKQIQSRFVDFQKDFPGIPIANRLFAVGCDGKNIVIVRHRGGKFDIEKPQPVTQHSVSRLLRALISLGAQGKSFTPDNLDTDFGGQSETAQKGVSNLYHAILNTQNPKAQTFFQQWKILFGEVCGYDMTGQNQYDKIVQLGNQFNIPNARPTELLFAVQSYYALFMKFLAAEIVSSFSPLGVSILKRCTAAPTPNALRGNLTDLERGGIWVQLGITNFLEGDLFAWYLDAWDDAVAETVRSLVNALDRYDPATLSVEPAESRDLLKKLYHRLFPKSVRHDLGEYYTPDWLAEFTLDELEYDGNPDKRLLDPACGSGTFLVMAINRVKTWYDEHRDQCGFGETALIQKILTNIIGFDLNPLAVMAARTNYLIALRELLQYASGVELPIFLCDAIMTPVDYAEDLFVGTELGKIHKLRTAAGVFNIPAEITAPREVLSKYTDLLENSTRHRYTPEEFLSQCQDNGLPTAEVEIHTALYTQLQALHTENKNGMWARIIKNAFAPLFIGEVDYVAGNPPWINWESLPGDYREATSAVWDKYNLRPEKGEAGRMQGGKKDLSMLFVHGAVDCYLKEGGRLGYVITQTLFKTKGAGEGFRQFRFSKGKGTVFIKPERVNDLGNMQVFDGATNHTSVFLATKRSIFDMAEARDFALYPDRTL
ncbi:MAG: N-6 DNA methylase [Armatimonadetes bacterium]|nr:N-6 DNA methylase [Armatimonadota bacterium]